MGKLLLESGSLLMAPLGGNVGKAASRGHTQESVSMQLGATEPPASLPGEEQCPWSEA